MNLLSVLFALLPVLVVLILLVWRRMAADTAGVLGWLTAALVAWLYFQTPLAITLKASLAGAIALVPHHAYGGYLHFAGHHHA